MRKIKDLQTLSVTIFLTSSLTWSKQVYWSTNRSTQVSHFLLGFACFCLFANYAVTTNQFCNSPSFMTHAFLLLFRRVPATPSWPSLWASRSIVAVRPSLTTWCSLFSAWVISFSPEWQLHYEFPGFHPRHKLLPSIWIYLLLNLTYQSLNSYCCTQNGEKP